jgi:predicted type IV restriction endonuclease
VALIKKKDANESDTVTVVADIFQDIFGYDKYTEITSEYAIRGTYCDLAIIDSNKKIRFLTEVKAVSVSLNENHIKQAIDYGSNAGVNWVILTNAEAWIIYRIKFSQPIEKELVYEFKLSALNVKSERDMESLFLISKDGQEKSIIEDFYAGIQVKNKFIIGNILNSGEIYTLVRRTIKRLFDDVKITEEEIADIMANDIIKREIIDSDESKRARKDLEKLIKKAERVKEKEKSRTQAAAEKNTPSGKSEPIDTGENV